MKILILSSKPHNIINNTCINNQSGIYAFFFAKWLGKYNDCVITHNSLWLEINAIKNLPEYDFCILSINRGARVIGAQKMAELRKKIKFQIITICGSNSIIGTEDLLLFTLGKNKKRTMRLFWGADFELLQPKKDKIINVLVDHQYYGKKSSDIYKRDKTEYILDSLLKYKEKNNITIKHMGTGCVNDVSTGYKIIDYTQSDAIDFRKMYQFYNSAHIYVVTHPECFGLSVIECAAAGALIVTPAGYINKDILKHIHHVIIDNFNTIDWDDIIKKIDIEKSVKMAHKFSYENAFNKLYKYMTDIFKNASINLTEPQVLINKPQVLIDKPQVLVDKPKIIVDKPKIIVDKHRVPVDKPRIIVDKPRAIVDKPRIIVDNPRAIVDKPNVIVSKPEILVPRTKNLK